MHLMFDVVKTMEKEIKQRNKIDLFIYVQG
jgi:hypothetical protein